MDTYTALTATLFSLVLIAVLLRARGRPDRVMTPVALFVGVEVLAVWPALFPTEGSIMDVVGAFPLLLAVIGLVGMVTFYIMFGGAEADATVWRGVQQRPTADQSKSLTKGLALLVACLVVLGVVSFKGLPVILTGGLGSLFDPVGNADQVALIRETRLSLTKGHTLLGDAYAGQGFINATCEVGWRVAVIVATLAWSWNRTRSSLLAMLLVDALAFVFLASAGSRSPVILCGIAGIAAIAVRYRLTPKHIAGGMLLAFSLMLLISPLSKGAAGGETLVERSAAVAQRVTDGNGQNNAQIVRLVNSGSLEIENGGLFVERLKAMVPGTSSGEPFALRVTRLAYGSTEQTTGYATPTQYGLLYADGGPVGVIAGYLASGCLLALAWKRIVRIRSPLGAVVAVEGSILLGLVSVSGIHGLLSAAPLTALAVLIAAGPHCWSTLAGMIVRPPTKIKQAV